MADRRPQRGGGETRHGQFFLLLLKVFTAPLVKNRKGRRRQAHALSDNPPSTAGTHRHHPTKIIQRKHSSSGLFPPFFLPCISLFKDWAFQSCVILTLSASLLFSFLVIVFLSRVFALLSFPPHHRCCGSSHHNPVSCPLNNSQVHTPCSCRDYTPTQTRSHGPVRAHRAPSKMTMGGRAFSTFQSGKITIFQFHVRFHTRKSYKARDKDRVIPDQSQI